MEIKPKNTISSPTGFPIQSFLIYVCLMPKKKKKEKKTNLHLVLGPMSWQYWVQTFPEALWGEGSFDQDIPSMEYL